MTTHSRKLIPPLNNTNVNSRNTSSSSSSSSLKLQEDRENQNSTSYSISCCYNSFKINPPFDSAMALTVLILLTALFFMGFFSIYIRRFADENSVAPNRRRRRNSSAAADDEADNTASYMRRTGKDKGVDPTVIKSLPVYVYNGEDVEQGRRKKRKEVGDVDERECAICLSEFEERDWVKEIPYCGHVFHVECIDTWLSSHVTCPLCRTAEFFPVMVEKDEREEEAKTAVVVERHLASGEGGLGLSEVEGDVESGNGGGGEVRIVVGQRDTWQEVEREVGPMGVRRTSSCSWFGERARLHRSLSF